jgi:hypothetical protein
LPNVANSRALLLLLSVVVISACGDGSGTTATPTPTPTATTSAPPNPIDGVLSPGEWDGAAHFDFTVSDPATVGGGKVPARILVRSDSANLYLAVRIARNCWAKPLLFSLSFEFDSDRSGALSKGDDGLILSAGSPGGSNVVADLVRWPCPSNPREICSYRDEELAIPGQPSGKNDVVGAAALEATTGATVVEFSRPLDSGDHLRDVHLTAGDTIGFAAVLRLLDTGCVPVTPACYTDGAYPARGFQQVRISSHPASLAAGLGVILPIEVFRHTP